MSAKTPYSALPDHCHWAKTHQVIATEVDPVVAGAFKITPETKVATTGGCVAAHIGPRLSSAGYTFFAPEQPHPILSAGIAARYGYGAASGRFGAIDTPRQLLQLAQRALGQFAPEDDVWMNGAGGFVDPYRPAVQPDGFATRAEFDVARTQMLSAFRRVLREADVFVFAIGATEAWVSNADGAVFPECPGVSAGVFDSGKYTLKSFGADDIAADFSAFMSILKSENPHAKVLLSVSATPLDVSVHTGQSVITTNGLSKAVLRVAADQICQQHKDVHYFPSYEALTGPAARGAYFATDLRTLLPEGVDYVMSLFLRHYTDAGAIRKPAATAAERAPANGPVDMGAAFDDEDDSAPELATPPHVLRDPTSEVVGLYSFPKSGNTWLRAIIAEICGIPSAGGALQKYVTDTHFGKALENPWPFQGKNWYFYKSHHKAPLTHDQDEPMRTDKIISIYRHPLDVFLSYLNFVSRNVSPRAGAALPVQFDRVEDLTPDEMEMLFKIWLKSATLFPGNRKFGNVFEAVAGFRRMQNKGKPVHIIRYEDLKDDFAGTVGPMIDFLGIKDIDIDQVFKGADNRTQQNGKFFWKRAKKNYEKFLTEDQIARFETKYAKDLKTLGY
ncbi:MAG: GSCFA domain-containing protein [Pikeienuella sp.]